MTRVRGRAMAAALALAAATGIWVLAVAAPAAAYVCAFGIDLRPTPSGSPVVHLTGPFVVRQGTADRVLDVTVVSWPPGSAAPPEVTRQGASVGPADRYDVPVGGLSHNGTYRARVTAKHAGTGIFNCVDGLGQDQRDTERWGEVTFRVSVQALPPTNVRAQFNAEPRSAVVTWDKSSDPDIAGYEITRKIGSDEVTFDAPPEPRSWTDTGLPAAAATITYSVKAARIGPDPNTTSELSEAAAAPALEVPAPPPPPTSTTGPTGGTGGTATTAKAGAPPASASTPTTRPFVLGRPVGGAPPRVGNADLPSSDLNLPAGEAPDDGVYRPLLPYPAREELEVEDGEVAADPAVVGRSEGPAGDGVPQLAYVASGLLSCVVAAHVLWLRKQVGQPEAAGGPASSVPFEPLEPLEPTEPLEQREPLEPPPSSPRSPVPGPPAPGAAPPEIDDAPPAEDSTSPFRPVLLVDELRRRATPSRAADEDGRDRAAGTDGGPPDGAPAGATARPARQPLRARRVEPGAAASAVAGVRRPRRSPSREPVAVASPIVPVATLEDDQPPAQERRRAAPRRPLRSPTRVAASAGAAAPAATPAPAAASAPTAAGGPEPTSTEPLSATTVPPAPAPPPPPAGGDGGTQVVEAPGASASGKSVLIVKRLP